MKTQGGLSRSWVAMVPQQPGAVAEAFFEVVLLGCVPCPRAPPQQAPGQESRRRASEHPVSTGGRRGAGGQRQGCPRGALWPCWPSPHRLSSDPPPILLCVVERRSPCMHWGELSRSAFLGVVTALVSRRHLCVAVSYPEHGGGRLRSVPLSWSLPP